MAYKRPIPKHTTINLRAGRYCSSAGLCAAVATELGLEVADVTLQALTRLRNRNPDLPRPLQLGNSYFWPASAAVAYADAVRAMKHGLQWGHIRRDRQATCGRAS